MTDFPNSPYYVLKGLADDFLAGRQDEAGFVAGLDTVDQFLENWWANVDQLKVPEGYEEGMRLQEAAREGLRLLADAVTELRGYAESRDEAAVERGLGYAREAHDLIADLLGTTQQNMAELESQM
ncbi:MAG: hypothetical protein AB1758_33040 [Candidatus Eremiobacterota bacterium]